MNGIGAIDSHSVVRLLGEDRGLFLASIDDVVGGLLAAPVASALRSPVLWKALLVRSIVEFAAVSSDSRSFRALRGLGRRLSLVRSDGFGFVGLSECDGPCRGCQVSERLSHVENTMASIETKLDSLLSRVGEAAGGSSSDGVGQNLMSSLGDLRVLVGRSLRDSDRMRTDNEYKTKVVGEMADGADKFLSGLLGRFETRADRDFFLLLIFREVVGGAKHVLTFEEIGKRLGGVTKQAAHARSKEFRHNYPIAWQYVMSIRRPVRADNYSELSPSDRRKHGIDKSYDHETS